VAAVKAAAKGVPVPRLPNFRETRLFVALAITLTATARAMASAP
jgi:hypothetical protein